MEENNAGSPVSNSSENGDEMFSSAEQEINVNEGNDNEFLENSPSEPYEDHPPSLQVNMAMEQVETEPTHSIVITITEPQKIGEGMSSYVAYRVITKTNMPIFTKTELAVLRRFSDFLGLHEKLTEKYQRSGRIIPPAPEKSLVGTTKLKMSSNQSLDQSCSNSNGTGVNAEFLERRRVALERFVNRVAQHPVLCIDPDFRDFLQSDQELPKATSTSALSGAGVLRLFNKVGETVNKITYRMDESDAWFSSWTAKLEGVEAEVRGVCAAVEALWTARRECANATGGAARAAANLSGAEQHPPLSRALLHLGDLHEKIEQLRIDQSNSDYFILYETLREYIGLIGAIKDAFHERVKVYQNWQHAQMQLTKRRENKAKAELANRPDKTEQASNEIVEWEAKVERNRVEFESISSVIKKEVERWERTRVEDLRETIKRYLNALMQHQAQAIRHWDAFLPEAKSIKL